MSAQRLGPRWLRRLSRRTGQTVVVGWSSGGYVHGFATEHHQHGSYDLKTDTVTWDDDAHQHPYSSCSTDLWPPRLRLPVMTGGHPKYTWVPGMSDEQELDWCEREMVAEIKQHNRRCTCPGGIAGHDDEAECPVSPPCTCGPVYLNVYCPRHGDPGANLP